MRALRIAGSLLAVSLGIALSSGALAGQSIWQGQTEESNFRLEMMRPTFDEADLTTFSSASFASGRWQATSTSALLIEVPFAYGELSALEGSTFDPKAEGTIGNIYVGFEQRAGDAPVFFELGARAPLVDPDEVLACLVGLASDLNRMEAFVPDLVPVNAAVSYRTRFDNGLLLFVKGGPNLWIPTEGGDVEVFGLTEAHVGYAYDRFGVLAGVAGRALLSEDLNFDERTNFQFGAGAWVEVGRVRPALLLRVPIDEEMRDVLNTIVGFSVDVRLN